MFKPTKKQHLVNKAYADKNGGSGGSDSIMVVGVTNIEDGMQLNKPWKEIYDAMDS